MSRILREKDKIYDNLTKKSKMVSTKFGIFDTQRLLPRNYRPTEIQTMFKIHSELPNK